MLSPRELYINSLLGGFDRLHEIRKARQRFGFVQGAMIQHKDMEGLCKGGGDTIHPDWEQRGVEVREFEKEAGARGRCNGPVERERVEGVQHRRRACTPQAVMRRRTSGRRPSRVSSGANTLMVLTAARPACCWVRSVAKVV
jgi:hypothetical protein